MVRPAVRTNPSQKRSFSKTLFKPAEFGNAALFLWLGLPSTLLHYENADFWKHSLNRRNLETSVFRFCVSDEDILKTKLFESDVVTIIMSIMISLSKFSSYAKPKWPAIDAFFKFPRFGVKRKHLMRFQSETFVWNCSGGAVWKGTQTKVVCLLSMFPSKGSKLW